MDPCGNMSIWRVCPQFFWSSQRAKNLHWEIGNFEPCSATFDYQRGPPTFRPRKHRASQVWTRRPTELRSSRNLEQGFVWKLRITHFQRFIMVFLYTVLSVLYILCIYIYIILMYIYIHTYFYTQNIMCFPLFSSILGVNPPFFGQQS